MKHVGCGSQHVVVLTTLTPEVDSVVPALNFDLDLPVVKMLDEPIEEIKEELEEPNEEAKEEETVAKVATSAKSEAASASSKKRALSDIN